MPEALPISTEVDFSRTAITSRPAIAALMMGVISMWSEVEHRWGILLAEILEAEASAGVAMFNAVENQTARGKLLLAAGVKRLNAKHQQVLRKLIKDAIAGVRTRNHIAHGQWGGIEGDAEGIV